MAEKTGISWCDSTANLWIGCSKVSEACDFCYAETLAVGRLGASWGPDADRRFCKQGWSDLRRWQRAAARNGGIDPELGRRRRVFINSLSDFFDNHRSVIWRADAWALFRECPDLILILVTKRPQLIRRELPEFWDEIAGRVILMATAENQLWADRRLPELLQSCDGRRPPVAFGVSAEPLLGPLSLRRYLHERRCPAGEFRDAPCLCGADRYRSLSWVIVGGESGKDARPMHPSWAELIRNETLDARQPFHFKQWGEWAEFSAADIELAGYPDKPRPMRDAVVIFERPERREGRAVNMWRIGKTRAGHKLAGVEYQGVPEL